MNQTITGLLIICTALFMTGCEKIMSTGVGPGSGEAELSASRVEELQDSNFETQTAQGVVLVYFWAPWCGPCRTQGPIVEKVAAQLGDTVKVAKVNVDHAPQTARKFEISSIPTLVILKNGVSVKRFEGVTQADALITAIKAVMDATIPVMKEM